MNCYDKHGMYGFTKAYINLENLKQNYEIVCRLCPHSQPVCIVKSNAYGHGAVECTRALLDSGAKFFAVANLDEAVQLREGTGGRTDFDILILGATDPKYCPVLIEYNIIQNVYSKEYASELEKYIPADKKLRVHIKLDTGMNRLGFPCTESGIEQVKSICIKKCFDAEGIFTHFACADQPEKPMTDNQLDTFLSAANSLEKDGIHIKYRHAAASSGIINYPASRLELVRPGVILYGMQPADSMESIADMGFKPVMTLKTSVVNIHTVLPGQTVSYGATFTAQKKMSVATLPIGYGDGFIRAYGGCSVLIKGRKYPVIGRICMDQCMIDITDSPVKLFDEVTVFGEGNPVEDFARRANSITYESTCILSGRVERIYI